MRSALPSSLFRHSLARQAFKQQPSVASRRFASEADQRKQQGAFAFVQQTASRIWDGTRKFLGPLGEQAGNLLGCKFPLLTLLYPTSQASFSLQGAAPVQFRSYS